MFRCYKLITKFLDDRACAQECIVCFAAYILGRLPTLHFSATCYLFRELVLYKRDIYIVLFKEVRNGAFCIFYKRLKDMTCLYLRTLRIKGYLLRCLQGLLG